MTVGGLSFSGFRNLEDSCFKPFPGVNILYGDNAQGKTNLIEAIWLFTGEKSFRGAKDAELVRIGGSRASLSLSFNAAGREQSAAISYDGSRKAALNGVSLPGPVGLAGSFCAVVFSPEHLGLVKKGPPLRRRFLDSAICQLHPRYAAFLSEYHRLLAQRNALLKDIPRHGDLLSSLDVWDERLCRAGASVCYTRLRYLRRLVPLATAAYAGISRESESLAIAYEPTASFPDPLPLDDAPKAREIIYVSLCDSTEKSRAEDLRSGFTHVGPHRDDLSFGVGGLPARSYASQGQQRSAVLALKLAEAAVLRESLAEPPVLLLDDVLSELDGNRREFLLGGIGDFQVFITCCDPASCGGLDAGGVFQVAGGRLSPRAAKIS